MIPRKLINLPQALILSLLLISTISYAQEKSIGVNLGFGTAEMNESNSGILNQEAFTLKNYKLIEFFYTHKFENAPFLIKSGVIFNKREIEKGNYDLSYISVPLGLDFVFGNKIQLVIGGGFYTGTIIQSKGFGSTNILNNFQFGAEVNAGFNFQLSERLKLLAAYQINQDITKTYDKTTFSPGGAPYQEQMIGSDYYLKFGLSYQLIPTN
jgi:opacity protein-like surface antigen